MEFSESFGRTVNSFIRNFAPWGIYAIFPIIAIAYWLAGRIWPDLSRAMAAVVMAPLAVAIYLVGFVGFATAVAIIKTSKDSSD
jgi:hypothetical protein